MCFGLEMFDFASLKLEFILLLMLVDKLFMMKTKLKTI